VGGLWLQQWWARVFLLLAAIPVAMALNAVRVFLTGFFAHYLTPAMGRGVMHYTEGWALFVLAFAILGAVAWGLSALEHRLGKRGP
jgi:exosortase/archaeosortase family protein